MSLRHRRCNGGRNLVREGPGMYRMDQRSLDSE